MKKIVIPIGILLSTGLMHAQLSTAENYIYTKTYLDHTNLKVIENVQYFDGLSRSKQSVNIKESPEGKDVVTKFEYDSFGRQINNYIPVPQSGTQNGGIYDSPLANATNPQIYGNEKIYSEKRLESSPLNRIQEQIQVGTDWAQKPVKYEYESNEPGEVYQYLISSTWYKGATKSELSLPPSETYPPGQLYKNIIKDEEGNETQEFKNAKGQVILVRKIMTTSLDVDTYYVYNEYDQLAFVLPPNAIHKTITGDLLDSLCYQYRYDGTGRLVQKKLPGKGWEYMVYDKQDRLILTRDTVMGAKGQWLFTKYDKFGRVAYTGILSGGDRETMQNQIGSQNIVEEQSNLGFNKPGILVYYTNNFLPDSQAVLSVNYYDTYPRDTKKFPPAAILGQPVISYNTDVSTLGMPTASYVKNIEDDNWTKMYFYYDFRGRSLGTYSVNHLGGYTSTESKLDFAGVAQNTVTKHLRRAGEPEVTVKERFNYDSQNRLLKHYHQVDYWPEQLLVENSYNELSQLKNKVVGGNLQSIDYAYNIRGWMTDINPAQMSLPDLGGKLFSYKIKYNQKNGTTNPDLAQFPGKNVKPMYNGNIAEVDWRAVESLGANPLLEPKRYGYAYDALNRLTAGYYQNPNNPWSKEHTEVMDYDLNGNITKLYRTSAMNGTTAEVIDELVYNYGPPTSLGNRLLDVKDNRHNKAGYEGGGNTISYDPNGNMINMLDKQITSIGYNFLNLPRTLDIGYDPITTQVKTNYRADGIKLRKENTTNSIGVAGVSWKKEITDYLDGFQYLNKTSSGGAVEMFSETRFALEQQAFRVADRAVIPPTDGDGGGIIKNPHNPELQFFPTTEGFYDYQKKMYIYQYRDHLGNVRVSFGRNNVGVLEITDANDYYPFGMNHLKTGNAFFGQGSYKNYKYQGQELLETGFYSFKWRNYMPDVGRFFNIDPLAEKFTYNSPYAFAENRVIDGRELEGLEWVSSRNLETKTVNLHLTYKPVNNTVGALSNAQMSALLQDREAQIVSSFGGKDSAGNQVNITFSQSDKSTVVWDYNIAYDTNNVDDFKGVDENGSYLIQTMTNGMTDTNNNTQTNRTQINVYTTNGLGADAAGYVKSDNKGRSDVAKTGAHETGHTLGIKHDDKATLKSSPDNLMRSGGPGTKITPEQRTNAINLVEQQQQQQQQPKTR
ncbi:DUF6443 domain-containing protein [Chryseobacterium sp. M5A1_1a]